MALDVMIVCIRLVRRSDESKFPQRLLAGDMPTGGWSNGSRSPSRRLRTAAVRRTIDPLAPGAALLTRAS